MSLSLEQIQKFEKALGGPAPATDPEWKITKGLLKLVVAQGREIIVLQEQLAALETGYQASAATLYDALKRSSGKSAVSSGISQADIDNALKGMNDAIRSYQSGRQIMDYAGKALKFAMLFI